MIKKEKIKVNSRHQHVVKKVNNLKVEGVAGSVIEAVTYPNKKFILGVQFHPEDMDDENANLIFKELINVSRKEK